MIGDICGRGMEAAAYMSQVRAAVRAYAVIDPSPASILDRCAALVDRLVMPDMITAGIGRLDLTDGRLDWASAGHPPPLVVPAGGDPTFLDHPGGPPLGAGPGYADHPLVLAGGDALVLYTDGAVEERGRSIDDGMAALRAAVRPGQDAAGMTGALRDLVHRRGAGGDDVALLVVARP